MKYRYVKLTKADGNVDLQSVIAEVLEKEEQG
jgi:hypothetical protein